MSASANDLGWTEVSRSRVASLPIFDVSLSARRSADGKTGEFCLLEAPDWVTVVPSRRSAVGEESFFMVRQYRHGADMITTEFPAGLVEKGEDPLLAAHRELAEETGCTAGSMKLLGRIRPNPAFMTNWCWIYLAEDLACGAPPSLDENEALEVCELPAGAVEARMGTGELVSSLAISALHLYTRARTSSG